MRRRGVVAAVLVPVLLAVFPALSLFAQNQAEVELSLLRWPLVIATTAALVVFGVLLLVTRSPARASLATSMTMVGFFYYGLFFGRGSSAGAAAWLIAFAAVIVMVLRSSRDLTSLSTILLAAAAVMTLPSAVRIVSYHRSHPSLSARDHRLWPTDLPAPTPVAGAARPDIFVIIPDDHARSDVLASYFHRDNTPFLEQLGHRGFVVADQSRSPYSDSESNIAATLNMDYLTNFPRVLGKRSTDVRPVKRVIADNRAARLLEAAGYQYVHLDTDEVTFAGGNPNISALAPPDSFANLWMRKSILTTVGGPLGFNEAATNNRYRRSIRKVLGELTARPRGRRPRFVVFHTLLPHDPYVFRADGHPVTFRGSSDASLSSRAGRASYLQQLDYLDSQLLRVIDKIDAASATPPTIVIQSDEGFQAAPEDFGNAVMKDIRVKGLLALRVPGVRSDNLPHSLNTVNSLRLVINQALGTSYPLLASNSYPEGDLPYDYTPMNIK